MRDLSALPDATSLALLLWATAATALAGFALRELILAGRRFDEFVRELARFNEKLGPAGDGLPSALAQIGLTKRQWFLLPMALRERWWAETDYGKRAPSEDLKSAIKSAPINAPPPPDHGAIVTKNL